MTKKNIVIFALIALAVGLVGGQILGIPGQSVSSVRQVADEFTNGFVVGTVAKNSVSGKITLGQNQSSWKNSTGKTVYVSDVRVSTYATSTSNVGTLASSTMLAVVGTSSASTIGDYAAVTTSNAGLINWSIATSTAASSTISQGGIGAGGQRVMAVPNGAYLNVALLKVCLVTSAACENSTSTNRGFNLEWKADVSYIK